MPKLQIPQKILLIRLSSIGDILLATPLVRVLRRNFPQSQIDFVVKSRFKDLIIENPHINKIYSFDETRGFNDLRRIKRDIRERAYDLIVDIHKNFRSFYLRTFAGAARIVKFNKGIYKRLLLTKFKLNFYKEIVPIPLRYLESLKDYGVQDDNLGLELHIHPSARTSVQEKLMGENPNTWVAVVPGAGFPTKCWLPEGFARVGDRLAQEFGVEIMLLGDESDQRTAADISSQMTHKPLDLTGRLSLMESAAALGQCQLVITNDTGLMHIAAALGKKVVAIFGPTTEEWGFFPYTTEYRVVQKQLGCRPCSPMGSQRCPKGHFRCMREITPEEVVGAAHDLLTSG